MNPCFHKEYSCSGCCGIYNLRLSPEELLLLLDEHTKDFLLLDLSKAEEVYNYRCEKEPVLRELTILNDIYICPFIGWIDVKKRKTGCLLHPVSSPHPMTSKINHPQSYSFYGESICQGYNCLSKEIYSKRTFQMDIAPMLYGRWTSNHNLIQTYFLLLQVIKKNIGTSSRKENTEGENKNLGNDKNITTQISSEESRKIDKNLFSAILYKLKDTSTPVTSFEMMLTFDYFSKSDLWSVLGTLLDHGSYGKDNFNITDSGKIIGKEIHSFYLTM